MPEYDFEEQHKKGVRYEQLLDDHFKRWFRIAPATKFDQRNGIDRIFTRKIDECVFTVEYKADFKAHATGHVFVETVSVDSRGIRGWILKTRAQIIAYYLTQRDHVYLLYAADMKTMLPQWVRLYGSGSARNVDSRGGYSSKGILVPIESIIRYSVKDYVLDSWL